MKVREVIKQYGLEEYRKQYFDRNGIRCDIRYPIPELAEMLVSSVTIQYTTQVVIINLLYN